MNYFPGAACKNKTLLKIKGRFINFEKYHFLDLLLYDGNMKK